MPADRGKIIRKQRPSITTKMVHIEVMRIVACFFVIVNHTEESLFRNRGPSFTWFAGLTYFFICKIAVPLFLMIMGAVLLVKMDQPKKTAKRLYKGVGVLIVASAFYYIYYGVVNGSVISISDFFGKVIRTQITNAFWYFYLYIGLLCLLPILQKMVKALDEKDIQWLLFLSVVVLGSVPFIHLFVPTFEISWYFKSVLLNTYIGILICGYYIENYVFINRTKFCIAVLLFIILIMVQVIATYWFYQKDSNTYLYLDDRTFITITGSAVCFYIMVKYLISKIRIGSGLTMALNYFGGLTFGMYLLSDLIIDLTRPIHSILCERVHVILAMGLWELLVFAICAVIAAALKQVPGLRDWL